MSTTKGEDYLSGRNLSIRDYNEDTTYHPENASSSHYDAESYEHGGSGTGQAGGYSGPHSTYHGQASSQRKRDGSEGKDLVVDDYGCFDPGLAGCKRPHETRDCGIPGIGRMGEEMYSVDEAHTQIVAGHARIGTRGYECDCEDYEDLFPLPSKALGGAEKGAGKVMKDPGLE